LNLQPRARWTTAAASLLGLIFPGCLSNSAGTLSIYPPANDLVNLCQSVSDVQNEAQPILYRSSELLYPDSGVILAWARTVTSRRHLATRGAFLTLPYELPIKYNSSWAVSSSVPPSPPRSRKPSI